MMGSDFVGMPAKAACIELVHTTVRTRSMTESRYTRSGNDLPLTSLLPQLDNWLSLPVFADGEVWYSYWR